MIGNNYQFSISGKARENMETVKRSSNNVIEFLQSEGYIRFKADSEASSKAIYEAYTRWCDDNAQKPMSANRLSSELAQNERLYNVEATNNVHVGGKQVRGFMGLEVINLLLFRRCNLNWGITSARYSVPSQRITVLSLPGWRSWKRKRMPWMNSLALHRKPIYSDLYTGYLDGIRCFALWGGLTVTEKYAIS